MPWLKNISIRQKLVWMIMSTSAAALLLACGTSLTYELVRYRRVVARDLATQAEIIGANSAAALAFHDPKAASEILSALHARPEVVYACLYGSDGRLFAEYAPIAREKPAARIAPEPDGHRFESEHLFLFRAVSLGGDPVGTILLKASMREQFSRLRSYAVIVLVVMLVALSVVLVLATRLHRIISEPILALADVTQAVTEKKDYSLRAPKYGADEIGTLTDGLNEMLSQIQRRDSALRDSEQKFRQLAESIHEVFWMTSPDKNRMLYISPGYEEIWGRSCESLYASPLTWLDAVHPEDRDHVRQDVLTKQVSGAYDEEYRILRPDGSVRWIRDRAFPVRDETGVVIRLAGIAEDITERKEAEQTLRLQSEVIQNMQEGIVLVRDSDATILYANPKFEQMFGYEPGELNGQPIAIVNASSPVSSEETARAILAALKEKGAWSGEIHNRKKDDTPFWCHANISTLCHPEHGVVLVSVNTDITERKRLEKEILEISDREQQRIGQDLHDGVCQHLAATAYAASLLEDKLTEKSLNEAAEAREIADLIQEAITQARALARGLYSVPLHAEGLVVALQDLADTTEDLWGISCRLGGAETLALDDQASATHLYRIAQEAVGNAVKHAMAKHITIGLTADDGKVTLTVTDDGIGLSGLAKGKGMGLHIMEYRARIIGGEFQMQSSPGRGTMVRCVFPVGS